MSGYFWNFRDKATAKYHGLTNLGSTCYLNSVLQVLFMTKEFRDAVIKFVDENPDTDFIDRHLKDLFDDLLTRDAYTYKIVKRLDIVRVYEQQDAAEYFEKILRLTCPNTAEIFHGQMTHRTTCSVCGTQKDTGGPFWHLPLELVDSSSGNYSVEDGIKTYFSTTSFSGDNQMYCDTCDTKVDATSSYVINNPDVLVLLLKRFDFSYEYMSYVKINRVVDVPRILTIPEKQVYELYAFVEHSGDLRGGHYNATIRPEDDEETWYNFDDSRVSSLDSSPFPDSVNITQSSRAYLLFYKKKQTEDVCTNRDDSTAVSETPDQILSTKNDLNNEERDDKLSGTQKRLREEEDPGQSEKRIKYTLEKPDELEVTDHENADQPEAGQTLDGEDTNTENSDSFSNRNLRSEDQSEARDPEDIEPTESAGMDPDVNQVFKPGDREISGGPAGHERGELSEAHGMLAYRKTDENQHEEEKMETNSEQFVPPAGPEGETSDMKSKSTNEKSEETENKEQHLLDEETKTKHKMERSDSHLQDTTPQNENLEEEHRSLPSTDDKNEGKDSANDELTENKEVEADTSHDLTHVVGVTAAVADGHERQQHTVHTQEDLMDKKAEINGINQKSEHLTAPDMTVNDANTDDPKKDINLSSGGDQIEVSYDERSNQSEADPMTPGGKQNETEDTDGQGDNLSLPSSEDQREAKYSENKEEKPAGNERQEGLNDAERTAMAATDDEKQNKKEGELLTKTSGCCSEDLQMLMDDEGNRNILPSEVQRKDSDPKRAEPPETEKIELDVQQEKTETQNSHRAEQDKISQDEISDELINDNNNNEDQTESEDVDRRPDTNQEENTRLPSAGDQNEVKHPEHSEMHQADQTTLDVKQDLITSEESRLMAPANRQDKPSDAQEKVLNEKTEEHDQTEKEVKQEMENSSSQNVTINDADIKNQERLENAEPALNQKCKPGGSETIVGSAALHIQHDMSDDQGLTDGEKDENIQTGTGLNEETENSDRHTEDKNLSSSDNQNEIMDPKTSDLPVLDQVTPNTKHNSIPRDREMSPLPAAVDTQEKLKKAETDQKTDEAEQKEVKHETENMTVKDEDPHNQEGKQQLPSTGDMNKVTEPEIKEPTEFEEMKTNSEQFVPPSGPEGETSDLKRKSANEKSEETEEAENKVNHETGNSDSQAENVSDADDQEEKTKDPPEVKNSGTDKQPEFTKTNQGGFRPEEIAMLVLPTADTPAQDVPLKDEDLEKDSNSLSKGNQTEVGDHGMTKETDDNMRLDVSPNENNMSLLPADRDIKQDTADGQNLGTEKSDSHFQDVTSQNENSGDQVENSSLSCAEDKSEIQDVNKALSVGPDGYERHEGLNDAGRTVTDATDDGTESKQEGEHQTKSSPGQSEEKDDDHEGNRNVLSSEDQSKVSDPEKAEPPEKEEIKQEKREKQNSDREDKTAKDKITAEVLNDNNNNNNEDQTESGDVGKTRTDTNQEKRVSLPSTGDQNEVKHPEKSEIPQADQTTLDVKQGNSDRRTEDTTMKDPDTDDHKEDRTLSSSDDQNEVKNSGKSDLPELDQVTPDMKRDNKPVDREMSPLPLQDELSDANSTEDKNKQTEKDDYNHQSLDMTSQDTDDLGEDRKLLSTDDQNKINDSENKESAGSEDFGSDPNQDCKPGESETPAGHERPDERSDECMITIDVREDETEKSDSHSVDMTSQHQNTDELEDQNKATDPENEELVEVVEVIPDVTHGSKSMSAELAVCYQKPTSVEKQKSGNVTHKENKKSATRSKHKQDVEVMVGDQEESRTLLSTETRLEVTDPENSGQPEVESTWERHKYRFFIAIGLVSFMLLVFIAAAFYEFFRW